MAGLLDGVQVVEIAHPHTEYAGLIFAGLGADVWLVEPPGGGATRRRLPRVPNAGESTRGSMAFLARNVGKKSVVLDPASGDDQRLLLGLCAQADVVFDAESSPFHDCVASAQPKVAATVSDELGLGVSSIVGFAASGGMASSGWPEQPPCNAPSWLALDGAGVYAAVMAAMGLFAAQRAGERRRTVRFEIPYHEAAVSAITPWTRCLHAYEMQAAGQGTLTARLGPNGFPIYETQDGYARILAGTPKQWAAFVKLLGEPEAIVDGPFSDPQFRVENADALKLLCAELIRERSTEDLFMEGQRLGLTISPVNTLTAFRKDPHVRARQILSAAEDPEFGAMERVRTPLCLQPQELEAEPAPAPALGADTEAARAQAASRPKPPSDAPAVTEAPLAGVRVLELGVGAVVPEAASLLALFGAEVVKVESLVHVDFLRRNGMAGAMDVNNSPTFNQLNLGVHSLAVDMSKPAGVAVVQRLAAECDIVMENMRGSVVARWGLDYAGAKAIRQDMVYLGSQGLGSGPYDGFQTYGPNLQTFSGVTHQWSHPDDPFPVGTTLNHPDHIAGKQALVPLLAALMRRDRTGQGCFIDATQVEAAAFLIGDRYVQQFYAAEDVAPLGNASHDMAPHGCYRCADDGEGRERWLALAVEDDAQWQRLAEVVADERLAGASFRSLAGRIANAAAIEQALGEWARKLAVEDAEAALRSAGVPASRVVTSDDMAASETSFFPALAHPTSGIRRYTGLPVLVEGERPAVRRSPLLGEHTEGVLHDLLKLPAGEVERLVGNGVVGK